MADKGQQEFSLLFDPRMDPNDEKDQQILYEISKLTSKLELRERLFKANKDLYGEELTEQTSFIKEVEETKSKIALDLHYGTYIPVLKAYNNFPSLKAPKSTTKVRYQDIPFESETVEQQLNMARRRRDQLKYEMKQLKEQAKYKKRHLPARLETEASKVRREQQVRKLVNSISKMQAKYTTAVNVNNTYQVLYEKFERDCIGYPKIISDLDKQREKISTECVRQTEIKNEIVNDVKKLHKLAAGLIAEMQLNRKEEHKDIQKLHAQLDPNLRPSFFSQDNLKALQQQGGNTSSKKANSMAFLNFDHEDFARKQKVVLDMMKTISVYEHIGIKLAHITKISFSHPEKIADWFQAHDAKANVTEDLRTKLGIKKKKKEDIKSNLRLRLDKVKYNRTRNTELKIKKVTTELNAIQEKLNHQKEDLINKQELNEAIIRVCGKWLKKFSNFCELPLLPAKSEGWLTHNDSETIEMFVSSVETIHSIAMKSITKIIGSMDDNPDLSLALKTLDKKQQKEILNSMKNLKSFEQPKVVPEQQHGSFLEVPNAALLSTTPSTASIVYNILDSENSDQWVESLSDEQKYSLVHGLFTVAYKNNDIRLSMNNPRISFEPEAVDMKELDDVFEPDDPNYLSAKKIKGPQKMAAKKK